LHRDKSICHAATCRYRLRAIQAINVFGNVFGNPLGNVLGMRGTIMASIAVVGGTGNLGKGIARRLAQAGHTVTIGSRGADKAEAIAAEMNAELGLSLGAGANTDVVAGKDVVIVTVPYENQESTLKQIAPLVGNAIVVDTTVPLMPPKVMRVQLPAAGCAHPR